jgi:hypothetical protein
MITQRLQLFAIVVGVIFLVMMIELIRKNRVTLKYALLWLFSGLVLLVLAIFPQVLNWISRLIGVYSPVNALFAILLCCGLVLMISFSVIVSGNKKAEVRLTQKISLLENRIRELEKQTKDAGTEAAEEKKE